MMNDYVFGPVPSRRLGRSLGIDLVPFKTCSYDCIYCQLGRTTCKTIERRDWAPLDEILPRLEERLAAQPDYITLSGSGEPTLHSRIGELIDRIKGVTHTPIAVLTNGSLLWRDDLRRELLGADVVIPSLDAGTEAMFRRVNRPHPEISFERLLYGLAALRREFAGEYWLEVFLLAGFTDEDAEAAELARRVESIGATRVQLNTVARPPSCRTAAAVSESRMRELALRFRPPADVITQFRDTGRTVDIAANRDHVLDLLRRRPCTVEDIAGGLRMHAAEVVKYVEDLIAKGSVTATRTGGRVFYQAASPHLNSTRTPPQQGANDG